MRRLPPLHPPPPPPLDSLSPLSPSRPFLDHPHIPLHTNASENDIRVFVTKRKISGGTLSDRGRDARDVMLGLAKTCRKLKIPFFDYLGARLAIPGPEIPDLATLVRPAPS